MGPDRDLLTRGQRQRRVVALAIAAALLTGASLRAVAALFECSPAKVFGVKLRYFGRGPIRPPAPLPGPPGGAA